MLDTGSSDGITKALDWGDSWGDLDTGDVSFHCWVQMRANPSGIRTIFNNGPYSTGFRGWFLEVDVNRYAKIAIGNGGYNSIGGGNTTAISNSTPDPVGGSWVDASAGTTARIYTGGSQVGSASSNLTMSAPNASEDLKIGSVLTGRCPAMYVGQAMAWDKTIAASDFAVLALGQSIPELGNLKFWAKAIASPWPDSIGGAGNATVTGSVSSFSHEVDDYYQGSGGFSFAVAQYWVPLVLSAAKELFGSMCQAQPVEELRRVIPVFDKLSGCVFRGTAKDHDFILRELSKSRPVFSC